MTLDSTKFERLRWPHYVGFGLLFGGILQLYSAHLRQALVFYAIAVTGGYNFCRSRETGQSHREYIKDPGSLSMIALLLMGGGVYLYSLITGHF